MCEVSDDDIVNIYNKINNREEMMSGLKSKMILDFFLSQYRGGGHVSVGAPFIQRILQKNKVFTFLNSEVTIVMEGCNIRWTVDSFEVIDKVLEHLPRDVNRIIGDYTKDSGVYDPLGKNECKYITFLYLRWYFAYKINGSGRLNDIFENSDTSEYCVEGNRAILFDIIAGDIRRDYLY